MNTTELPSIVQPLSISPSAVSPSPSPPFLDGMVFELRSPLPGDVHRYRNSLSGNWQCEYIPAGSRWWVMFEEVSHGERMVRLASQDEYEISWSIERWRLVSALFDGVLMIVPKQRKAG